MRGSGERLNSRLLGFLRGRTEILERLVAEMDAHGLSRRDIELAFTDATGGCVISKSLVSEVTERLWQEYQAFRQRRLDDREVEYLFCDGVDEPLRRTGQSREALLCLWAICADGRKMLVDVVLGNRESRDAWLDCRRGLVARRLPPVLLTSDGALGLVAALEQVFPKALRRWCLAHKTRNVLAKVSLQDHAQVKASIQSASDASSPQVARLIAQPVVGRWQGAYPSTMASFLDDFKACIASLRCPPHHHKDLRTTNLAERSIEEERRRTKVIPRFWDEKSGLKTGFAALWRGSRRWQRVRMTDWDRRHLEHLRQDLCDTEGEHQRSKRDVA